MTTLPTHARVVIIGGGAVGCSALYHLAKRGWSDAVLLEKNELTSGSTWHAAGNCPNFSGSWGLIKLQRYSTELYARLAEEADYPINYHVTGAIRLAHGRERLDEFRHITGMARHQGIAFEMLGPNEIRDRYPFVELDGLSGAQWDPYDGDIDPAQLTQAFAKAARDAGARIFRFCPVTGLSQLPGGEWRVETAEGSIIAEVVVNAAGYRADEIGATVGREIPNVALSHQYLVTEEVPELAARREKLPLLRDPDDSYYLRQEGKGLLLGPYEWQATAHWVQGDRPADFSFQLFPDDLDRLEKQIGHACVRVPILGSVGIKKVINGPIPYTPDGNPLIGPAPGLRNFFEACVFSFGIVQAGGAGKALADWVTEGEPEWDLWSCDPRRYTGFVSKPYVVAKAVELYQNEYAVGFPFEERPAGRPAKTSPLYPALRAKGALFGARNGWERAVRFPRQADASPLTLQRPAWLPEVGEECRAVAERVGVCDLPGFSRFELRGAGAAQWLDGLIAGALPKAGRVSLAYVLTEKGGVKSEMTVTRLAPDHFWLLTASSAEWHDRDLLLQHRPPASVTIENVTETMSTLVVAGPKSRVVLCALTDTDLDSQKFPWLAWQRTDIGGVKVTAIRVNYVGELGWELHVPMARLAEVYEKIWEAGAEHGIADFGLYAIDCLRLEKCYRGWKQDLSTEWSALAAGLGRFVKFDKPDFPGRAALLAERERGPAERFVPLILGETEADAPAYSTVFDGETRVGLVTSGGYGFRIGKPIALAYVRSDLAVEGRRLEVEVLGKRCAAIVGREPLYDPQNERLKA
ncbi:MAG TPA: FAD-dependent oxidoreductase [Stellaceae bacterium]|nr:FAD-dependent oxidoreductase [Stellaceae bacterium]